MQNRMNREIDLAYLGSCPIAAGFQFPDKSGDFLESIVRCIAAIKAFMNRVVDLHFIEMFHTTPPLFFNCTCVSINYLLQSGCRRWPFRGESQGSDISILAGFP